MAAQAVVFQDCRASDVNLKRNLIQTSLGRRQRGFYVLFCVLNVPWVRCTKSFRVLFLHRRPPSWTTLVLYSRAVFIFLAIKARITKETNSKGRQFCQSSATQADKLTSKKRTEREEFMNENGKVGPWSFLYAFFVTNASAG
jgi:hypothetical protein